MLPDNFFLPRPPLSGTLLEGTDGLVKGKISTRVGVSHSSNASLELIGEASTCREGQGADVVRRLQGIEKGIEDCNLQDRSSSLLIARPHQDRASVGRRQAKEACDPILLQNSH